MYLTLHNLEKKQHELKIKILESALTGEPLLIILLFTLLTRASHKRAMRGYDPLLRNTRNVLQCVDVLYTFNVNQNTWLKKQLNLCENSS